MDSFKKRKKIIGCDEINSLPIDDILTSFGYKPVRRTKNYCLYRSPLREDKNPSFITYRNTNKFKDMATGETGSVVDFIVSHENCSVKEAILLVKERGFVLIQGEEKENINSTDTNQLHITSITGVEKYSLLKYGIDRGISEKNLKAYFKEVNYQINGKNYFSLGLENVLGGWELRNKYMKSSINGKSFSFFKGKNPVVWVTEGMFDYASLLELKDFFNVLPSDSFIILNSISNYVKSKRYINFYNRINILLDNDESGKNLRRQIFKTYGDRVVDYSNQYTSEKDLNDFLVKTRPVE